MAPSRNNTFRKLTRLVNFTFFSILVTLYSHPLWAQENLSFGRFSSRAIFNQASVNCPAPLVILVPGSGANGPEEMIPANLTGNGKDQGLFNSFASAINKSGHVGTLAIGKPGVNFFKSWQSQDLFYDKNLYVNLSWQDLILNLADAVEFAASLPCVDPSQIILLGHSEGTQVATDFTTQFFTKVKTLIYVGFSGESLQTTLDWQLFQRPLDSWLVPDVDTNRDGLISKTEVKDWPEFQWDWKPGQNQLSFLEIEADLRANVDLQKFYQAASQSKLWQGVFNRTPIYEEAANLKQNIYAFTGDLDVQTRPQEALKLKDFCSQKQKANCEVTLVPGLGHGMSPPSGPRKQKFLDATLGPVDQSFLQILEELAPQL